MLRSYGVLAGGTRWAGGLPSAAIAVALTLCLLQGGARADAPDPPSKIQPWLTGRTREGARAEFFVVLKDRADLALAEALPTKDMKGWFVYQALTETAERSQRPLRDWLDARGIGYRPYFIVNALLITGDRDLILELAARPDVKRIEGNPEIANDLPQGAEAPQRAPECLTGSSASPSSVEWGIQKTRAPEVWAQGYRGQGIVVGGQDTGYRWTHSALKGKYRGWDGTSVDHNYNWHDSVHNGGGICGADSPVPCDDDGHGTHTMGTVLGDDGEGNQVGMAPEAKWIGCRNMNKTVGSPAKYLECFQFFLAPTRLDGTGADPSRAPDVTTNSWGCPESEGCSWDTFLEAVAAQRAAGIMTVVAAGNSGQEGCSTIRGYAAYDSTFTVGATLPDDNVANFSSLGPGKHTGLIKPDVVAPGVAVRSAWYGNDTGYAIFNGTSTAAPNVAGGVALLWSARPCYRRAPDLTGELLRDTAVPLPWAESTCGGDGVVGPNNTWGAGLLDVQAAVGAASCDSVPPTVRRVAPSLGPASGGTPVTLSGSNFQPGASVSFDGTPATAVRVTGITTLECVTPPHGAGAVEVAVTNPGGRSSRLPDGFTYTPLPEVTGVAATSDPFQLKVSGTNFLPGAMVSIDGLAAPSSSWKNETRIVAKGGSALKAIVPVGVPVQIVVVNPDGGTSAPFTYVR